MYPFFLIASLFLSRALCVVLESVVLSYKVKTKTGVTSPVSWLYVMRISEHSMKTTRRENKRDKRDQLWIRHDLFFVSH